MAKFPHFGDLLTPVHGSEDGMSRSLRTIERVGELDIDGTTMRIISVPLLHTEELYE